MNIGIASDHRGYELKCKIINYLKEKGYTINDYGTDSDVSTDYPIYAFKLGESIRDGVNNFGILICGTGIGMSIACNKVKNVRCAKVNNIEETILTRQHNDANVIALSENAENALEIVEAFINTEFSNEEKHIRRVEMISNYDN